MASETEDRLCEVLKKALGEAPVNTANVKVCRKTKDLVHGDFVVPRGVLDIDLDSEDIKPLQLEACIQKATSRDFLPVSRIAQDKYNSVIFYLDRHKAFSAITQQALSAGPSFGCSTCQEETDSSSRVTLNPVDLHDLSADPQSERPASLSQLRAVVLLKHVLQLFVANGYTAEVARFPATESVQNLLEVFHVETCPPPRAAVAEMCERVLALNETSPWRQPLTQRSDACAGTGETEDGEGGVVLNLKKFVECNDLPVGKGGYDKNIHLVNVKEEGSSEVSDVVREVAVMKFMESDRNQADSVCPKVKTPSECVHLVSQSQAFTQQQAALVWRMCSPDSECVQQRHLVFGSVGGRKSSAASGVDAKEFYNVRHQQMAQAAMMKYGDHDQGVAWDDMVAGLTMASISFDVLSSASSSQVQLDLSEDEGEGGVDNRSGPFVLYNCARLSSLATSFQQRVQQGLYPPLPDPADVSYQHLREEEEWTIALLYVHTFPRLVREAVSQWSSAGGVTAALHTHKVAHFLLNFSKTLSSYYSRYHILGGGEPHLLPVMFARLSLMKAAHLVLCRGLSLLGLQPFHQL